MQNGLIQYTIKWILRKSLLIRTKFVYSLTLTFSYLNCWASMFRTWWFTKKSGPLYSGLCCVKHKSIRQRATWRQFAFPSFLLLFSLHVRQNLTSMKSKQTIFLMLQCFAAIRLWWLPKLSGFQYEYHFCVMGQIISQWKVDFCQVIYLHQIFIWFFLLAKRSRWR